MPTAVRAEAEERLFKEEYRVGRATRVSRHGVFETQVRHMLVEMRSTVPPPDDNNRPSVRFHKGVAEVAANLDWLKGYETSQVQVFHEWNLNESTGSYVEGPHIFDGLTERRAKVFLNLPRLLRIGGADTITRGTCIATNRRYEVTKDGKVGAYVTLVVVLELDKWQVTLDSVEQPEP